MSNSHLIDPAMNRLRGITRLSHCIPCPDARLPLKRRTLVPEPMRYRLLLTRTTQQNHFESCSRCFKAYPISYPLFLRLAFAKAFLIFPAVSTATPFPVTPAHNRLMLGWLTPDNLAASD